MQAFSVQFIVKMAIIVLSFNNGHNLFYSIWFRVVFVQFSCEICNNDR